MKHKTSVDASADQAQKFIEPTVSAEFARGWPVVVAALIGVATGISGLLFYSVGLFAIDLGHAIGLNKTMLGVAIFSTTLAMCISMPAVGFMIDRFGVKIPALLGALCLSVGFAALGTVVNSVTSYVIVMAMIGLGAAGSAPVAYSRAVSSWFTIGRGRALGIAMMGIGVSGTVLPILLRNVIENAGWRQGFLTLAVIALVGMIPTALFLKESPKSVRESDTVATTETQFSTILRDKKFWHLLGIFGIMALAFTGITPNLVPMLVEGGLSTQRAAMYATLVGVSVIFTRVGVGWLLDVFRPNYVAAAVCILCAAGVLSLAVGGITMAPFTAIALGMAVGAEIDMLGFFTARYFDLEVFGRVYAWLFGAFLLATGISPLWIGVVVDRTGSYAPALIVCVVLMICCAAGFATLSSRDAKITNKEPLINHVS